MQSKELPECCKKTRDEARHEAVMECNIIEAHILAEERAKGFVSGLERAAVLIEGPCHWQGDGPYHTQDCNRPCASCARGLRIRALMEDSNGG